MRRDRSNRRYLEAVVPEPYIVQGVALQMLGKLLQAPIQFLAPLCQPFVRRQGQAERGHDRFRLWLAEQIAVEPTISRRSFNPDISGADRKTAGLGTGGSERVNFGV